MPGVMSASMPPKFAGLEGRWRAVLGRMAPSQKCCTGMPPSKPRYSCACCCHARVLRWRCAACHCQLRRLAMAVMRRLKPGNQATRAAASAGTSLAAAEACYPHSLARAEPAAKCRGSSLRGVWGRLVEFWGVSWRVTGRWSERKVAVVLGGISPTAPPATCRSSCSRTQKRSSGAAPLGRKVERDLREGCRWRKASTSAAFSYPGGPARLPLSAALMHGSACWSHCQGGNYSWSHRLTLARRACRCVLLAGRGWPA